MSREEAVTRKRKKNVVSIKSEDVMKEKKKVHLSTTENKRQCQEVIESDDEINSRLCDEESEDGKTINDADDSAIANVKENEFASLRKEMHGMTFLELEQLREQIGVKLFNEIYFRLTYAEFMKKPADARNKTRAGTFARENKNRPKEMSFKRPVRQNFQVKKKITRDPRFDDLSGTLSEATFKKNYSFLQDIRDLKEKPKLKKELKKTQDPERRQQLKGVLKKWTDEENRAREKESLEKKVRELKQTEKERIKEGKNPFYLKKSELKKLELVEKFERLKKSGKLKKYLEKKEKKTAAKEHKRLNYIHRRKTELSDD